MEKIWLKHYDPTVPEHLDYPQQPLHVNLERAAREYPQSTATIYGAVVEPLGSRLMDARLTYQQLNDATDRLAAGLQRLGVKKGDRVGVLMPNIPQFIMAYYASLKIGAVVVPTNPLYTAREVEYQMNNSGAETLITISLFYPLVQEIRPKTSLKHVIVTNVKEYFPGLLKLLFTLALEKKLGHRADISGDANTYWFQDFLKSAPTRPEPVDVQPEDLAVLMYTGGTTGVSKGAMLTHANLVANVVQAEAWLVKVQRGQESVMTVLPLFHSFGMTCCMNIAVYLASAMILIPNPRDLHHVLKSIVRHRPTLYPGVPTMYVAINNFPGIEQYDLSSIRACISGAAGLPVEVHQRFTTLTGAKLIEGYGLSEASPVVTGNPLYGQNKVGTIGIPWPDTEVKIMDLTTGETEMPLGEAGELVCRGPQVMKGYWKMPEETAMVLRTDAEGKTWLYTGDIARMDEDGYFYIVDRKKELIKPGGYQVWPREVEEVLAANPKVKEVAVAGIPDPYRGETVKAWIVLKPGESMTEDEVKEWCKDRLAKFKIPTHVEFREGELPKTTVGKILRRELVRQHKEATGG